LKSEYIEKKLDLTGGSIYRLSKLYNMVPITCRELLKILKENKGDHTCLEGYQWVQKRGDLPAPFSSDNWWLIQTMYPHKKLYVLANEKTEVESF